MKIRFVVVGVCLFLMLAACEDSDKHEVEQLHQQISNLEIRLQDSQKELVKSRKESAATHNRLKEENVKSIEHAKELAGLLQKKEALEMQLGRSFINHERLLRVMEVKGFTYEEVGVKDKEKIVFIQNVTDEHTTRETYLLRAAIEFSDASAERISFWDDRDKANTYLNGDYDDEASLTGWSGFDSRFGSIIHSMDPPTLTFHLSRDDGVVIEFGKYGYAEQ